MPTKRPRLVLIVCIIFALIVGAWFLRATLFGNGNPSDAYVFATAERADLEDLVTATGTLQPREYVDVGAQVSGTLDYIHVEVGDEVEQDQLLAEIDPRVLRSRVEATRAQLRSQEAQLIERQANLELAEIQHHRQKNLMAADATSRESLQTAAAALRSARAQVTSLEAQIEQTQSNLSADEANLEYTRIVAPMRGTVVSIEARQGQTLNANQQAPNILRIADLSIMSVETEVSEADVGRLRLGMDVWFTTLGGNSKRWEGTLRRIDPTPTVTNNVVLYNALFDVPNPDRRLMTQMTAQVFFVIDRAEKALTVPLGALKNLRASQTINSEADRSGPPVRTAQVRVANAAGLITEREVEVGMTSRVTAQILSGLSEGERVVAGLNTGGAAGDSRSSGSR